ncbi:MAG: MBL fold metallo-hydrolase [Desulfatibacillaceae bacterium]
MESGLAAANVVRANWMGLVSAWVYVENGKALVVDSGVARFPGVLFRAIERTGVAPEDVVLAVATHHHHDHAGCMAALRRATGCEILAHEAEVPGLLRGVTDIPGGLTGPTRWIADFGRRHAAAAVRMMAFPAVAPDIVVTSDANLAEYGFSAHVVHTPGHTAGSISVVTSVGHAFTGDAAYNHFPLKSDRHVPPFGMDAATIVRSWPRLLRYGARWIYPAHGRPFSASRLEKRVSGPGC